jgi:mono/diheme cytochrome c family protein
MLEREHVMRLIFGVALLVCLGAVAEAQMHGRHGEPMRGQGASMVRHHFVHSQGLDEQYASKGSPLAPTADELANGRLLFERNCASCHGAAGAGDGEAGAALDPPPADLARASRLPIATDAYLYWTIAEGGMPVGSAMPPFKAVLSESEIWQVVAHLRTL